MSGGQDQGKIKLGKSTFLIQVQFRQNATWQGSVDWLEERKTRRFRSVLELVKLLDEALAGEKMQPADFTGWSELPDGENGTGF